MPAFLGLGAQVVVNGKALKELGREESLEEKRVTCYIPSEIGQHFSIRVGNGHHVPFSASVHVDGVKALGILVNPGEITTRAGVHVTERVLRPFAFARLELTDDDSTLTETRKVMDNIGVIEIRFHRVICGGATQPGHANPYFAGQPIHEKSKMAGCHRVSLGNATLGVTARFYNVHYVDDVDQPFARYLFRYRPLDILQAHGIAPQDPPRERSAGPGPSTDRRDTGKRPSEGVTSSPAAKKRRGDGSKVHIKLEGEHREKSFRRKQVDEMKRQLEELQAKIKEFETSVDDSDELSDDDMIKRELSPVCVPPASRGKHAVIDLTR